MTLNLSREQEDPILLATGPVANLSRQHAASSGTFSEFSDDLAPAPPPHGDGADSSGLFDETRRSLEGIRTKSSEFSSHGRVASMHSSVSQYSGQIVDEPLRYAVHQQDILSEDKGQNLRRGLSVVRQGHAVQPQSDDGSVSRKSTIKIKDLDRTPTQPRRGSQNFADDELENAYQVLETRNFIGDTPTSSYSDDDSNLGRIQPNIVLTTSVEPPVPPRSSRRPKSMIIDSKGLGQAVKAKRRSHKRASLSVTDGLDELMLTAKKELFTFQNSPGESIDSIKSPGEIKSPDFLDTLRIETSHETYMTAESQGSQSDESELHEKALRQTMEKLESKKALLPPRPSQENIRRAREVSQQILLQELLKHTEPLEESPLSFDHSKTNQSSFGNFKNSPSSNFEGNRSINTAPDQLEVAPPMGATGDHLSQHNTPLPLAHLGSESSFHRNEPTTRDEVTDYEAQTTPTSVTAAPKVPQLAFSGRQVSKQIPPPLVIPPTERRRDELDHLTTDPVVYEGEDSVFSETESPLITGSGDGNNESALGVSRGATAAAVTKVVGAAGTAHTTPPLSTPRADTRIPTEGGAVPHIGSQNDDGQIEEQQHVASVEDDDGFYDIEDPIVTQHPGRARSVKASTTQLQLQLQQPPQQKRKKSGKKTKRRSEARQSLKPFTYQTLISLLESTNGTVIGEELRLLDLPAKEKQLIEKIIDALSRLSADMVLDKERYEVGITRLENALRVLEGFL